MIDVVPPKPNEVKGSHSANKTKSDGEYLKEAEVKVFNKWYSEAGKIYQTLSQKW